MMEACLKLLAQSGYCCGTTMETVEDHRVTVVVGPIYVVDVWDTVSGRPEAALPRVAVIFLPNDSPIFAGSHEAGSCDCYQLIDSIETWQVSEILGHVAADEQMACLPVVPEELIEGNRRKEPCEPKGSRRSERRSHNLMLPQAGGIHHLGLLGAGSPEQAFLQWLLSAAGLTLPA
jgi:hypothetical protein